ncbi:MAG: ribonuclease HII [Oscillospiraceae bacterium]|nr:ribonuclease HII [Oscillospiraceae bacterium]
MTYEYENEYREKGYKLICGIDEAGRGPLAGPVFAAAVILPDGLEYIGLNDSKKLSEKKRDELFDVIKEKAVSYCIASADENEIDGLNILNATFLAMKRAIEGLKLKPDLALIDGNRKPNTGIEEVTLVKGDGKSISIAAASILAKVSRDRYMLELDKMYPEYNFRQHKGYPTKLHYEKIKEHGISPVHRLSFLKTLDKH